ncbi:MAG: 5-oxoprolinase subunit PxpB, partial [Peptostreptococcaceae bacterium]
LEIKKLEKKIKTTDKLEKNIVEIPVLYGGEFGPDIETVARHNNLSVEEVMDIHSKGEYLVYMLGFTPGFTYLGGMDNKIETPRLEIPRVKIPAGSVGIAGKQTGVYPIDSPGGWQLIGRTPIKLYDINKERPILLSAGDYVKFVPINKAEYEKMLNEGGTK